VGGGGEGGHRMPPPVRVDLFARPRSACRGLAASRPRRAAPGRRRVPLPSTRAADGGAQQNPPRALIFFLSLFFFPFRGGEIRDRYSSLWTGMKGDKSSKNFEYRRRVKKREREGGAFGQNSVRKVVVYDLSSR